MKSTKSINAEFLDAVKNHDLEKVEELIKDPDLNINCVDELGNTALHIFAQMNWEVGVKLLLQNRIDTTIKNHSDKTALSIAQSSGKIAIEISKAIARAQNLPLYPNRKLYVIIGYNITDYPAIKKLATEAGGLVMMINDEKSFDKVMRFLKTTIDRKIKIDPDIENRIIIVAHGDANGHLLFSDDYSVDRSEILKKLSIPPRCNNLLIEFCNCKAGAGVMRTDKSPKLATATEEQKADYERGNFNQDRLTSCLPPNWQVSLNAGKLSNISNIYIIIVMSLLQNNKQSTFACQATKLSLPQTFKFIENIDQGQTFEFKSNAPKLADLQKVASEDLPQYYRQHIINNVKKFKAEYLENHPNLLPFQIAEITWEERELISFINDADNIKQYMSLDLLMAADENKLDRVQFYIDNFSASEIKADLNYTVGKNFYDVASPLITAFEFGNIEVAKALVKAGVDVDFFLERCIASGKNEGEMFKISRDLGLDLESGDTPSTAPAHAKSVLSGDISNVKR